MNNYRSVITIILITAVTILSGCTANQPKDSVSPEQSQFYDGKAILPFLAEYQAKTPEEAMQKADSALLARDLDRALFNYIRAYELDNTHVAALNRIGEIHYQRGNLSTSYQAYQTALQIDPNSGQALKGSGMIQLNRKAYSLAQGTLTRAVENLLEGTDNQNPLIESYTGLGIINDLNGDYQQSALYYKAAEQLAPNSAMVKNNLGYSYYMQEKWVLAEQTFQLALQADSTYTPAWKNLGLTYARQQRYLESLTALEQVMESSRAYNDIGYICLISKRYQDAAKFFRKAIKVHPQYYPVAQQNLTRVKRLLATNPDGRSKL